MRIDNGNENDDDNAVNLTQLSNESSSPNKHHERNENDDDTAVNLTQLSNESSSPNKHHESVELSFTNDINEQEVDNQSNVSEKTNQFQKDQSFKSNEVASIGENQDFDELICEEETSEFKEKKNAQAIASIGIIFDDIMTKYKSKNDNEKRNFLEKSIYRMKKIVEDYCSKEDIDVTNEENEINIGEMKISLFTFD